MTAQTYFFRNNKITLSVKNDIFKTQFRRKRKNDIFILNKKILFFFPSENNTALYQPTEKKEKNFSENFGCVLIDLNVTGKKSQ